MKMLYLVFDDTMSDSSINRHHSQNKWTLDYNSVNYQTGIPTRSTRREFSVYYRGNKSYYDLQETENFTCGYSRPYTISNVPSTYTPPPLLAGKPLNENYSQEIKNSHYSSTQVPFPDVTTTSGKLAITRPPHPLQAEGLLNENHPREVKNDTYYHPF